MTHWSQKADWIDTESSINRTNQQNGFGECFLLIPMKVIPNKTPSRDPDRLPEPIYGVWNAPARRHNVNPGASVSAGMKFADVSDRKPEIEFNVPDLPYEIKQGDRIERLKFGDVYTVNHVMPNGNGTLCVTLLADGVRPSA
jgi:hypothetical protein